MLHNKQHTASMVEVAVRVCLTLFQEIAYPIIIKPKSEVNFQQPEKSKLK